MLANAQPGCYVHQRMNTYRDRSNAQACGAQVASEASTLDDNAWLVKPTRLDRTVKMIAIPVIKRLPDDPEWEKT
jgi:hypothetical protein